MLATENNEHVAMCAKFGFILPCQGTGSSTKNARGVKPEPFRINNCSMSIQPFAHGDARIPATKFYVILILYIRHSTDTMYKRHTGTGGDFKCIYLLYVNDYRHA